MLKQLREKFKTAMNEAELIRKKYDGSSDNMTSEEEERWTKFLNEADGLKAQIENLEKQDALAKWMGEPQDRLPQPGGDDSAEAKSAREKFQEKAFSKFLKGGYRGLTDAEVKALQADNPAGGGYLVSPQQFVMQLLANVKDMVFIRQMATVFTLDHAESLGVPTLDGDIDDADWTAELATGNEDTGLKFGKRELKPNPVAKRIKLSNKLLRQAAMDPAGIVRDRMGYKFGITEEKAFLIGSGANQPLGIFTPSNDGISTSRDRVTSVAADVKADDFIDAKHDLKPQYWNKAAWIFHRDVLRRVRKLKDSNNNYIWAPGLGPGGGITGGSPATLLELPYHVDEYAPNTFTSGKYVAALGDYSFYWIADALDMQVQVLDQLYAEKNQTGFIGRKETDGMPVLEEAFVRVKLQ